MKSSLERRVLGWALLAAGLSLGGAMLLAAPVKRLTNSDPALPMVFSEQASPELIHQGRRFYEMSCSQCHGDDARGDEGPDLHNLSISNARLVTTIKKGIKGEMPTFAKKYDDRQISALTAYLRSLR